MAWKAEFIKDVANRRSEFEEFVQARSARLLRTAILLSGDVNGAEDLLQTALWRTFRRWRTARDNPDAYLRAVLVNLTHDSRRHQSRRVVETVLDDAQAPAVGSDAVGAMIERDVLFRALRKLPPRQRATVVLRFWDDASVEETASIMQCTAGTVKSTTSKALSKLREVLGTGNLNEELELS